MEEYKEEERPESYFIPDNFKDNGKILNGMFDTRKFLESVALTAVVGVIEKFLIYDTMENMATAIMIMICTCVPLFIIGVIGFNGDPFSIFCQSVFIFLKNKRQMRFKRIQKETPK